jgi:hypothetical protein
MVGWSDGAPAAYSTSSEYTELRHSGLDPDSIFWELRGYAGANDATSDREQAAALAILAHFFEECDIFERPDRAEAEGRKP